MQPESFKKGDLFEKFVEIGLFKATEYDLIHTALNNEKIKIVEGNG